MTLVVGLTGGIGSGKTAISDRFAALGVPIIDTDLLSREVVEPGRPALAEIEAAFGRQVIAPDGTLDRKRLGRRVFGDPADRQRLEAIVHPRIRTAMLAHIDRARTPYVIVVIPLLLETGQDALVDRILVVDVPETTQRQRVQRRDGLSDEKISQILAAQVDRKQRLARANHVIRNEGSLRDLDSSVAALHRQYLALAG